MPTEQDWEGVFKYKWREDAQRVLEALRANANRGTNCSRSTQISINVQLSNRRFGFRLLNKLRVPGEPDWEGKDGGTHRLYTNRSPL